MTEFEQRLAALDTTLFDGVPCQLYDDDRRSLLAVQAAVRRRAGSYRYLEIGSYLGGSLQAHLLDPRCEHRYSIDKRPVSPPDDRGVQLAYPANSTRAMMEHLRRLDPAAERKITTFESDAAAVDPARIDPRPELCFIDGEHTEAAVRSDFQFCRRIAAPGAAICFHDVNVVFPAIAGILEELERAGTGFQAYALPSYVFVIELGGISLHTDPLIAALLAQNWRTVIPSLMSMEHYREVYNTLPVRALRAVSRSLQRLRGRRSS